MSKNQPNSSISDSSSSRTSRRIQHSENGNPVYPIGEIEYNMLILQVKNNAPRTPDVL
ncbi:7004_t:CDS:2, partial [Ambispora leptoticha]